MIKTGRVGMVPISSIVIDVRAREVMGDLDGLENNMRESGLISPLAVKDNGDGSFKLLAGERRYTVLNRNEVVDIPVRIYDNDLSELEMKVIEKSENFFRKDMEFYEFDKLTAEIHQLMQAQHGVPHRGPGSTGWRNADTAEMIGAATPKTVTDSLKRNELRELLPEAFEGCKSASDADKIIKKLDEAVIKQTIATKLEAEHTEGTFADLAKRYIIKDFFVGVKEIPDGIMHLVEIDPPYAIDLQNQKKKDGESQYVLEDYNEVDVEKYPEFVFRTFKECYRVMAQHSWLICWFAPQPWFSTIYSGLKMAGFETTQMCGVWTKSSPGQNMNPQVRLSNSYEMFFYAWKGQPVLNKAGRANEFRFSPVPGPQKTHPTERPIELMHEIYDTFAFPGSRVLIPFAGSGNGILAAHQLKMNSVAFDLSKGYKDSFLVKAHLKYQQMS